MLTGGQTHTILGSKSQRGLTQLALDVLFRSIGPNMLEASSLPAALESLQACDPSESLLSSAPQFLDSTYADPLGASRTNSRAATSMTVRFPHALVVVGGPERLTRSQGRRPRLHVASAAAQPPAAVGATAVARRQRLPGRVRRVGRVRRRRVHVRGAQRPHLRPAHAAGQVGRGKGHPAAAAALQVDGAVARPQGGGGPAQGGVPEPQGRHHGARGRARREAGGGHGQQQRLEPEPRLLLLRGQAPGPQQAAGPVGRQQAHHCRLGRQRARPGGQDAGGDAGRGGQDQREPHVSGAVPADAERGRHLDQGGFLVGLCRMRGRD